MYRRAGKLGGRMEAVACPSRVQTGGGSDRSGLDAYLLLWHLRLREQRATLALGSPPESIRPG